MNYFKAEKIDGQVTCIRSLSGELMYLIEGEREALLMDTCLGCGSRAGSNSQLPCRHTFRTQVKLRLTTFQLPKIQAV